MNVHQADIQFRRSPPLAAARYDSTIERASPYVLSLLRIVVALLFFEHGTAKLFGFPAAGSLQVFPTLGWVAGAIELFGGALLAAGLFSRTAALIMSGEMALAYFMSHAPHSFFPIVNRGDSAVLYCFAFFFLAFAGPGPLSLDAWRKNRGRS